MEFYKENTFFSIEKHVGNNISDYEHFHGLFEFYYLKEGNATYLINDKIYNLVKGDIMIIPPNTLHKTVYSYNRERILFYLDSRYLNPLPEAHLMLPTEPVFFHSGNNSRSEAIFEEMMKEADESKNSLYTVVLICELLILLKRTAQNTKSIYESADLPELISKVLGYITANYHKDISLQSISKLFYVNPSYLSRLFKKHTGFTFCNYLNQYRIKEANILLTTTDKHITEIALECGFNSSNNFCKCYRKIMETSPLKYRKRA